MFIVTLDFTQNLADLRQQTLIFLSYIYLFYFGRRATNHIKCVEVRGQVARIGSLLPPCVGSRD